MKKIVLLLAVTFFAATYVVSQTKKIALESHGGKKSELRVDGDGNFGGGPWELNPILLADMRHYSDSIRKADSVRNVARKADSIHRADSIQKVTPKKNSKKPKKAKAVNAAASFGKTTSKP